MIGRLRGVIVEKKPPEFLLDVQGVGYEITAPMSTFYQLPSSGEQVTILTHLAVREDAHVLYGFWQARERELFRRLIRISGIGPKLALAILSGVTPDQFMQCIIDNDLTSLTRIPGVGKKTGERLLVEMRDHFKEWQLQTAQTSFMGNDASHEAISALIALGYKPVEATKAVSSITEPGLIVEEIIRRALQGKTKHVAATHEC